MAGLFQFGDFVVAAKLAGLLYEWGWNDLSSCSRQYIEFGQDVKALSSSLDILVRVVEQAGFKLLEARLPGATLRFDAQSLREIIGNCHDTIVDSEKLLNRNADLGQRTGPRANIQWHMLVQKDAQALRLRMQQHTAKVNLALAPLEVDLLSRIQRDIQAMRRDIRDMHRDLSAQIAEVNSNVVHVLRRQGVVVQDLQQDLARQQAPATYKLEVPLRIQSGLADAYTLHSSPSLSELSDIFVKHFYDSTVAFRPASPMVVDLVPPDKAYINLLKCVWLLDRIKSLESFRDVETVADSDSHWPSYVKRLERELSDECRRFEAGDLVKPPEPLNSSPELLRIWPLDDLDDEKLVIQPLTEIVLETRIVRRSTFRARTLTLQLLRHVDSKGRDFTVNISDTGDTPSSYLDFNVGTAVISPIYVVNPGPPFAIMLRAGREVKTLEFEDAKDAMRFQQAATGYRVQQWESFRTDVTLVSSGHKKGKQKSWACVQVWYPKQMPGIPTPTVESSRPESTFDADRTASIISGTSTRSPFSHASAFDWANRAPLRTDLDRLLGQPITASPMGSPTDMFGEFPGIFQAESGGPHPPSFFSTSLPRDGFAGQAGRTTRNDSYASSGNARKPLQASLSTAHTGQARNSVAAGSILSTRSSGSSDTALTVAASNGATGVLHEPPPKPMLVLLMRDDGGERTMLTLDLATTEVKPDLCNCGRRDQKGLDCREVCLESRNSKGYLDARHFKPADRTQQPEWDMSRLAYVRRAEQDARASAVQSLNRVTITFQSSADRQRFCGRVCACANRGKSNKETAHERRRCVTDLHRGIVGLAREHYFARLSEYERDRNERPHVVNGPRPDN